MSESAKTSKKRISISDLYPDITPEQQQQAEYFLRRYIDLIRRIYERVEREKRLPREQSGESFDEEGNLTD